MRRAAAVTFGWVVAAVVVCALVFALLQWGLDALRDGDRVAYSRAGSSAEARAERLGYWNTDESAEEIAAYQLSSEAGSSAVFTPFRWSGTSAEGGTALVDVRISIHVDGGSGFSGPFHDSGDAERCYRFTVTAFTWTTIDEIDCPAGSPDVRGPSPEPRASLAADAEVVLAEVLARSSGELLRDEVRAAFPGESTTVDTVSVDGELVAAVGEPGVDDCLVMVRHATGVVERVSFRSVWAQPGELGCSVQLYTAPPL